MPDPRAWERIGYTLRALAADLVAARRQLLILRRENRELRAKLAALEGTASEPTAPEQTAPEQTASDPTAPRLTAAKRAAPEPTAPEPDDASLGEPDRAVSRRRRRARP